MAKLSSSNGIEKFPKLRFPGFDEPWKEISFSNLFDFLPNNTITRANLSNNGAIRNIHYGDVLIKFGSVLSIRSDDIPFIKNTDTVNNNVFLKNGDIVIADTAEDETVGKVTEIFDIDTEKVVSGLHTIPCRPKKNFAPKFLGYYMNSPAYHYQLFPLMQGVKVLSISKSNIVGTVIHYPDILQQTKITNLLSLIDKKISVQRQLVEALKKYKRGSLSALFPKKREITPQYRFAGFTNHWEQRKLSEMCGTFEYGLNAAAKEFDGKNKYIRITDIDDASREFLLSDLSSPDICLDGMSKYLLSSGDIVFARTGASVGKTYIYRENDGIVYFAGFLIRAKVNQDNDAEFVFQSTLSPSYEKYIRITSQRSGQPGVNAQEYGEYDLFAPSKEEQQRIGHFLRGIDNLITLHQHKYDILLSLKNALLQQMFI